MTPHAPAGSPEERWQRFEELWRIAHQLHLNINVAQRRDGGSVTDCNGDDCTVCYLIVRAFSPQPLRGSCVDD